MNQWTGKHPSPMSTLIQVIGIADGLTIMRPLETSIPVFLDFKDIL